MNFPLDNLTSKKNLNLFSTPKFTDIQFDKDNPNKSNFFDCESLSKDAAIYGSKNMNINILEDLNNKMSDNLTKNKEDSNQNNKDELILKENFSLSSIGKYHTNNNINIINININNNKKMDKDEKNNIALMSFCDKLDNYSFNNYSCSTYKDKKEKNNFNSINNMKSLNEAIYYNESEIKKDNNNNINSGNINTHNSHNSNSNSNSNENNSTSFKYNLPLENDKIPLINYFVNIPNN